METVETTLGAPDPEELARQDKAHEDEQHATAMEEPPVQQTQPKSAGLTLFSRFCTAMILIIDFIQIHDVGVWT